MLQFFQAVTKAIVDLFDTPQGRTLLAEIIAYLQSEINAKYARPQPSAEPPSAGSPFQVSSLPLTQRPTPNDPTRPAPGTNFGG